MQPVEPAPVGNHVFGQGAIAAALGQCERAVAYLREATRQGTGFNPYMDGKDTPMALRTPLADCPAFRQFVEPKG